MGKSKAKSTERWTRVSANNAVVGNIAGAGRLEIRGRVEGEIEIDGDVAVAEGALVDGRISADVVTILGVVRGDVTAKETLRIGPKARVEAGLAAPNLIVETGARISGPVRMTTTATIYDARPPEMDTQVVKTPDRDRDIATEVGARILTPEPLFVSIAEPTIRVKGKGKKKGVEKRLKRKRLAVKVRRPGGSPS